MSGISGKRGTNGGTLTPDVLTRYAAAFAACLKRDEKPANGQFFRVVLGRDSRPSGAMVRDAAAAGLLASGIEVIDLDVVSTPGVAMMVQHTGADAGLVITASHNPIQWNGVKFLTRESVAPPPAVAQKIIDLYHQDVRTYVRVQDMQRSTRNSETHALHVKKVLNFVDVNGISNKRYKVVLDSINGAGCVSSMTLLSKLGCQVVHMNGEPTGQFAHEPEPTVANLTTLAAEVKRQHADIGFAQDPDADRLAIVDEHGTYIGEEYTLALAAKYMLCRKQGIAVANLSSSRMLDDIAAAVGATVIRTAVGEANVSDAMKKNKAVIGGEGNGGVIDLRIVPGRDSLVGMAYVLQLMADTGKKLSELVAEIPRYEIVKTKFECRREDANKAVEAVKAAFASEKVDTQDGVRVDWAKSWVHARASNTEPIMRIIAEAPTKAEADEKVARVQAVVNRTLGR
jgi:phosphomannomutase